MCRGIPTEPFVLEGGGDPEQVRNELTLCQIEAIEAQTEVLERIATHLEGKGRGQDGSADELIRWMAQTVHRAYHTDKAGHFWECPRFPCVRPRPMRWVYMRTARLSATRALGRGTDDRAH